MAVTRAAVRAPAGDRAARFAERVLRLAGDARTGAALLAATGLANLVAAALAAPRLLEGAWYAALLGLVVLSAVASCAVRAPAAWREWRRPVAVHPGRGAHVANVGAADPESVAATLASRGWRVRTEKGRGRWAVHAVRRGWSRFAGIASHLALVFVVLGLAVGAAFGSEATFSLFSGDQALLDAPRPGFSSAVRLDAFDAEFGSDGRPRRLDTRVTFLRSGAPVESSILRVNEPGSFDGYLVHPWTYGPAVRLRVTTLGGRALLDAAVPLDAERDGVPVGAAALPTVGLSLGLALVDAERNVVGVSAVDGTGLADSADLRPGQSARLASVEVAVEGFDSWVTFLSRRDPGMGILAGGGALLVGALATGLWFPRRRLTVRPRGDRLQVVLRGDRFDRADDEMARVVAALGRGA